MIKKVVICLLVLSLWGCSKPADNSYTGKSKGMQGDIKVSIEVKDDVLSNIELIECSETKSITDIAVKRIISEMLEHNTADVDLVSGATVTSYALMAVVKDGLKQAGVDLSANAYHKEAGEELELSYDVAVIGAGGAGYSCAITAAEEGLKVLLIEKNSYTGGNTLLQGGAFNIVDTEAQKTLSLSKSSYNTLLSYLEIDENDCHFDLFPEWEAVLRDLKQEIRTFLSENDVNNLPGFDSENLALWQMYSGGLRELLDGSYVASDLTLARTVVKNAPETYRWLVDEVGVKGSYGEAAKEEIHTVLGGMWTRAHMFANQITLRDALEAKREAVGADLLTETAVEHILVDENSKVCGVQGVKADGTAVAVSAKAVVLTTGGYGANSAMAVAYDNYWGNNLSVSTLTTNVGSNRGDGIVMAQELGADVTGLDIVQLMPSSSPLKGTLSDGIWANDAGAQLWVDGNCKRFVNEYAERDVLSKAALSLDNGIYYIIYAGNPDGFGVCSGAEFGDVLFNSTVEEMIANGHVFYGSTLKELSKATQSYAGGACPEFSEEELREVIENYNTVFLNQSDPEFNKGSISGFIDIAGIEADENVGFVISPRRPSIHHTMGGVKINEKAEVLNTEGQAIAGLFAAGEVTGGIHGGNRLGGNAVADVFTFGRIAGFSVKDYVGR